MNLGWIMFADDRDGTLAGNLDGGDVDLIVNSNQTWVLGWLDYNGGNTFPAAYGGSANTNTKLLTDYSPLAPYLGRSAGIFKCPSDKSLTFGSQGAPRVRSISMNSYLGQNRAFTDGYRMFAKATDIVSPSPSKLWVFVDEREDSINDGRFIFSMEGYDPVNPGQYEILDFPASYHNRAAGFSFADGHAEIKKWQDSRTTPGLKKGTPLSLGQTTPDNRDVAWMQERTSSKEKGATRF
jgi:prepilin-type processing-associated H-X9-DG protein